MGQKLLSSVHCGKMAKNGEVDIRKRIQKIESHLHLETLTQEGLFPKEVRFQKKSLNLLHQRE